MVVNRSTSAANWSALAKTSRTACCNSTGRWDTAAGAAGAAGAAWICGSLDALWFLFVCVCCFFLELMIFGSLRTTWLPAVVFVGFSFASSKTHRAQIRDNTTEPCLCYERRRAGHR